jgi:hypothetical protein
MPLVLQPVAGKPVKALKRGSTRKATAKTLRFKKKTVWRWRYLLRCQLLWAVWPLEHRRSYLAYLLSSEPGETN